MSLGDDWPEVDSGRNVDHEGAFTTSVCGDLGASTSRLQSGVGGSNRKESESMRAMAENTWLDRVRGPSSAPPKCYGDVSTDSHEVRC
jgi:hypothetical protein